MMRAKPYLAVFAAAGLLGGCSVVSTVEDVATSVVDSVAAPLGATPRAPDDGERIDSIAFAAAYCSNDAEAALAATREMIGANPESPRVRLIHGMALDLAGRGVAAYRMLEPLAAADHRMAAVLKCGKEFVYSGTVTEVAQRRLFEVRTRLAALGAGFSLPPSDNAAAAARALYAFAAKAPTRIDDTEPTPRTAAAAETPPMPPVLVPSVAPAEPAAAKTPPARNADGKAARAPAGRMFVHLGSYRSMKTLEKGWRVLTTRFAKTIPARDRAVTKVDLGKKGKFLRLGIAAADAGTAKRICDRLRPRGQYCAVMPMAKSQGTP